MRIIIIVITILFSSVVFGQYDAKTNTYSFKEAPIMKAGEAQHNIPIKFSGSTGGVLMKEGTKIEYTKTHGGSIIEDTTKYPKVIDDSSFYRNKEAKQKLDTLNVPIVTIKESMDFLQSFHKKIIAMKELNLIADREFNSLVNELNRIVGILEKKKKLIR